MAGNSLDAAMRLVNKSFAQFPEELKEGLADAALNTAEAVVSSARSRVPIDTGALRDALATKQLRHGYAMAGVKRVNRGLKALSKAYNKGGDAGLKKADRNPVRYAHLVEFGSKRTPAKPFMMPAAEGQRKEHADRVKRAAQTVENLLARKAPTCVISIGNGRIT